MQRDFKPGFELRLELVSKYSGRNGGTDCSHSSVKIMFGLAYSRQSGVERERERET